MRIALCGAGLVGRRHAAAIRACEGAALAAITDPDPAARVFAEGLGVPYHAELAELLADPPDAIVLATPNAHHFEGAMACIAAGVPVLVEKPLVTDVDEGRRLVEAAEAAGVPLLAGHHRRHNPRIAAAKRAVDQGKLGRIVSAQTTTWLTKPDDYFDVVWRREEGAGPVRVNLVHDVDLLRHLIGDVVEVFAFSQSGRGHAVEDAAVATLLFASGALGTVSVSDAIAAPVSWELTAREDPAFPPTDGAYAWIGGTHGSLELPSAALWSYPDARDWKTPIGKTFPTVDIVDPLVRQIENFVAVARGEADPVVSGMDGLKAVAIVEAVQRSARTGRVERPEV